MATRKGSGKKAPPKPRKPAKVKRPPKPRVVHVAHRSVSEGKASGTERVAFSAAGAASSSLDLLAGGGGLGLTGAILDLVGEGQASIGQALVAFQREQDRVSNRLWRRPGGMARMGGI